MTQLLYIVTNKKHKLKNTSTMTWQLLRYENKLTLNVKNTKTMLIGNKKLLNETDHLDVKTIGMDSIEQVGEFKYVGVWLDSSLKCTCHISKMYSLKLSE